MKIFTYHHCDEWATWNSMEIADTYYADTEDDRRKLLAAITADIDAGYVELIGDFGFLNNDISCGNMQNANDRLKYGHICVMEPA